MTRPLVVVLIVVTLAWLVSGCSSVRVEHAGVEIWSKR